MQAAISITVIMIPYKVEQYFLLNIRFSPRGKICALIGGGTGGGGVNTHTGCPKKNFTCLISYSVKTIRAVELK